MKYNVSYTLDLRDGSIPTRETKQFDVRAGEDPRVVGEVVARGRAVNVRSTTAAKGAQVYNIEVRKID